MFGDIIAAGAGCGDRYVLKTLDNEGQPIAQATDRDGNLWLLVGFASAYEGWSDLHLRRIRVELAPDRR